MKELIVSTIQFKPEYGKPGNNRKSLLKLCRSAVEDKSQLLVLPEMCTTGYIWPDKKDILPMSENAGGETCQMFSGFCLENRCYLAYGFPEWDNGKIFNSQNLIGPDGELITTYRKVNLFDADFTWAYPGNRGYLYADTSIGRIGLGICMDLNFNNFIAFHIQNNTDWLLISTNWLEQYINVHAYWKKRIKDFKGTVFIANSYGFEYGIEFCGQSSVFSFNEINVTASKTGNSIITTTHDLKINKHIDNN